MAEKCVYCDKRQGERECPALGGLICPICCGEYRGTEIKCPTDCRYFQQGEEFQQQKRAESYRNAWLEQNKDHLEEENYKALNTMATLEKIIFSRYQKDKLLTDDQIIAGLTELKKKLKPIEVPTKNYELTEEVSEAINHLIERGQTTPELVREAVDRFNEMARDYSEGSRELVQGLTGRVKEDYELPEEDLDQLAEKESIITTPDQLQDYRG